MTLFLSAVALAAAYETVRRQWHYSRCLVCNRVEARLRALVSTASRLAHHLEKNSSQEDGR